MPKVTFVKKAQKNVEGTDIKAGESYYWWKFKNSPKNASRTAPKPSQLTRSEFWGNIYGLQESYTATPEMDEIEDIIDEIKSQLEEWRDEQEEKRSNMPEGLQDSGSGEILQERYDALDSAISELDSVDFSFDEPEKDEGESDEDYETRLESEKDNRAEDIWSEVESALSSISCS